MKHFTLTFYKDFSHYKCCVKNLTQFRNTSYGVLHAVIHALPELSNMLNIKNGKSYEKMLYYTLQLSYSFKSYLSDRKRHIHEKLFVTFSLEYRGHEII